MDNTSYPLLDHHILGDVPHNKYGTVKLPRQVQLSGLERNLSSLSKDFSNVNELEEIDALTKELDAIEVPTTAAEEYESYTDTLEIKVEKYHKLLASTYARLQKLMQGELPESVTDTCDDVVSEIEEELDNYLTFNELKSRGSLSAAHTHILTTLGMTGRELFRYDLTTRGLSGGHYYIYERLGYKIAWDGTTLLLIDGERSTAFNRTHLDYSNKETKERVQLPVSDVFSDFEDFTSPTVNELKMFRLIHNKEYPSGYLKDVFKIS